MSEEVVLDASAVLALLRRVATRSAGLSLGDRACLALGMARGVSVVTMDRAWVGLSRAAVVCLR